MWIVGKYSNLKHMVWNYAFQNEKPERGKSFISTWGLWRPLTMKQSMHSSVKCITGKKWRYRKSNPLLFLNFLLHIFLNYANLETAHHWTPLGILSVSIYSEECWSSMWKCMSVSPHWETKAGKSQQVQGQSHFHKKSQANQWYTAWHHV